MRLYIAFNINTETAVVECHYIKKVKRTGLVMSIYLLKALLWILYWYSSSAYAGIQVISLIFYAFPRRIKAYIYSTFVKKKKNRNKIIMNVVNR